LSFARCYYQDAGAFLSWLVGSGINLIVLGPTVKWAKDDDVDIDDMLAFLGVVIANGIRLYPPLSLFSLFCDKQRRDAIFAPMKLPQVWVKITEAMHNWGDIVRAASRVDEHSVTGVGCVVKKRRGSGCSGVYILHRTRGPWRQVDGMEYDFDVGEFVSVEPFSFGMTEDDNVLGEERLIFCFTDSSRSATLLSCLVNAQASGDNMGDYTANPVERGVTRHPTVMMEELKRRVVDQMLAVPPTRLMNLDGLIFRMDVFPHSSPR